LKIPYKASSPVYGEILNELKERNAVLNHRTYFFKNTPLPKFDFFTSILFVLIKTPKDSSHLKRLGIEVSSLNSQDSDR
jgi:hypothetical protein